MLCAEGFCDVGRGAIFLALAKEAAAQHRVPAWATRRIDIAGRMFCYHAARLGKATHDANNHRVTVRGEDGTVSHSTIRDSTAAKPWRGRKQRKQVQVAANLHDSASVQSGPSTCSGDGEGGVGHRGRRQWGVRDANPRAAAASRKRASSVGTHRLRLDLEDECRVARHVAGLSLSAAAGPSAQSRIDALRARVARRASGSYTDC